MRKHRVFFAILPPKGLLPKIEKIISKLSAKGTPVRWEDPQKVHLTVVFMGTLPADKMEQAAKVASQVAQNHQPLSLRLGQVFYLFKKHADSIIYLGVEDLAGKYRQFYQDFIKRLRQAGFLPSTKPTLHLTIGRLKKIRELAQKKQILETIIEEEEGINQEFEVSEFHLLESLYAQDVNTTKYHLMKTFQFSGTKTESPV